MTIQETGVKLYDACCDGKYWDIQPLLRQHPSLLNRGLDEYDCPPVYIASCKGRTKVVEKLVSVGADINKQTQNGDTPLIVASLRGYKDIVEILLSAGADVHKKNKNGCSALYIACQSGKKEIVDILIGPARSDINTLTKNGGSPLYVASWRGYKEIVQILLSAGADIHQKDKHGSTPLFIAAQAGQKEIIFVLVSVGADVNQQDKYGFTPLHIASNKGHKETVEIILSAGGDIHHQDQDGLTPLHVASIQGHKEIVEILLFAGSNIHKQDKNGKTAETVARTKEIADLIRDHSKMKREYDDFTAQLKIMEVSQSKIKQENDELKAQIKKMEKSLQGQFVENYQNDFDPECNLNLVDLDLNKTFGSGVIQKHSCPLLTIIKAWGFKKNPLCQPRNITLDIGEKVVLVEQLEGGWWEISHPEKGPDCVHKSCFDVLESNAFWGCPGNQYARPGDEELEKGEEVVLCEKHENNWWRVFAFKKRKEILVHSSIFDNK